MVPTLPHEIVCFGETLWDILPDNFLPGGAPMNVAYNLMKLGLHPALITRVGSDVLGSRLVSLFRNNGLTTDYFQVDYTYPTGKVYAHPDERGEVRFDIVYPAAWDCIGWNDGFIPLLERAEYFVYGTLSARSPESRNTLHRLLEAARTKVLDVNLRPPYVEKSVVEPLLSKADILQMNAPEFEIISGWYSDLPGTEDRMKVLQDRFHIQKVVVSRAAEGAIMLDEGSVYRHDGFAVKVDDSIGCGEGFIAGLLYQFINGAVAADVLPFANALGALIATYPGACPDYDKEEIFSLMESPGRQV